MSNGLPAKNWFVALNGTIIRHATLDEIRAEFPEKYVKYLERIPKGWSASSKHVQSIVGWGDTPEEAILDFEQRMKLP